MNLTLGVPRYGTQRDVLGLPADGRAMCVSNSERALATCDLRWWFAHGAGLGADPTRRMDLGTAWGAWLFGDLMRWWAERDTAYPAPPYMVGRDRSCPWCDGTGQVPRDAADTGPCVTCAGTGRDAIRRAAAELRLRAQADPGFSDDVERDVEGLARSAEGYLVRWGGAPPESYAVVGVEVGLAMPVVGPSGAPYAPEFPVVVEAGVMRPARSADPVSAVEVVRWPWYYVGRLDALGRDRATGRAWVVEGKYTSDPRGHVRGLLVDPQLAGYSALVAHAAAAGLLPGVAGVAGYFFDVTSSSYQHDPVVLKAGGLSVARNRTVPTWRWDRAVRDHGAPAGADDHRRYLADEVDRRLYTREPSMVGADDAARFRAEVYGVARHLAALRRAAVTARTAARVAAAFPRTPVCKLPGGSCPYRAPCLADTPEARADYPAHDDLSWRGPPGHQLAFAPDTAAAPDPADDLGV